MNHKETKTQLLKTYATSSSSSNNNNNNKTKYEEPPLRTAHSLQHSKFKSNHRAISYTKKKGGEKGCFHFFSSCLFFVAEGELKYQREKLKLDIQKTLSGSRPNQCRLFVWMFLLLLL